MERSFKDPLGSFKILEDSVKIFQRSLRNVCKDLSKIFVKILQDLQGFYQDLARILGKIPEGSLVRSFKILEDSIRIFERSLRNLFKDFAKIFAKILQDLQGSYQDLAKILDKIPKGSLLGSFKILKDYMRIFERSLRNLCKDLAKIFVKILQDLQGLYQDLTRILGKVPKGSLLGSFKILEDHLRIFQRSLRNLFKDIAKIFAKILHGLQGSYQDLAKILCKSQQDLS